MHDPWHAFIDSSCQKSPQLEGPLNDTTFAVKDVFDVEGCITSGGNPDWRRTHTHATQSAHVIGQLLASGATLRGKTHTDELMYGLNGENAHYGTPINPRAPERIPGGSSSGSAAAVAGELVDFALGTDTGGSVRIPASYTGIFGYRPTIGRISLQGVIPLSQTFDTVGCMARSPALLEKVSSVLLNEPVYSSTQPFSRAIIAQDALAQLDQELAATADSQIRRITASFSSVTREIIAADGLDDWSQAFRIIQGYDIWRNFGKWILENQPQFGPGFHERFYWTRTIRVEDRNAWSQKWLSWREELWDRLRDDTIIVLPTAPGLPPKKNTPPHLLNPFRDRVLQLTCIAGLGGLPQISIPVTAVDGVPFGLSVIAGPGLDEALLSWVRIHMGEGKE
ncbi:MAG: amidase [Sulfobacillus benefaciens]|uniref:Amidase n=1 Tax=Sulfobacillus benefaciens TaxID=453960 RepID=A0A2T2X989_9FIRM|nr:MAG: amidase [Sulfobacillus benefaciens]